MYIKYTKQSTSLTNLIVSKNALLTAIIVCVRVFLLLSVRFHVLFPQVVLACIHFGESRNCNVQGKVKS